MAKYQLGLGIVDIFALAGSLVGMRLDVIDDPLNDLGQCSLAGIDLDGTIGAGERCDSTRAIQLIALLNRICLPFQLASFSPCLLICKQEKIGRGHPGK